MFHMMDMSCVSYDGYEHLTDKFYMDIPGLRKKLFVIKLGTITNNSKNQYHVQALFL